MIIVKTTWIRGLSSPIIEIDEEIRVREDGRRFYKVTFEEDKDSDVIDLTATLNLAAEKVEAYKKPTDVIGKKVRYWETEQVED